MTLPGNAQALGRRTEQQDAFAFSDLSDPAFCAHSGALCVVCDGMGGHAAGADAARAAVAQFLQRYCRRDPAEPIARSLEAALHAANDAVLGVAAQAGDSGSTLVAAVLHQGLLRWIGIGDSRLMLLRDGRLHRVNQEHRYRSELLRQATNGELPWAEALADPQGELLTASLGETVPALIDRSLRPVPLRPGDQVYLATDGLYRSVDEAALLQAFAPPADDGPAWLPDKVCAAWVGLALAAGLPDQDNVTVAGLAWEAEPPSPVTVIAAPMPAATAGTAADVVADTATPPPPPMPLAARPPRVPHGVALVVAAAAGMVTAWVALRGNDGAAPPLPARAAAPAASAASLPAAPATPTAPMPAARGGKAEPPPDKPAAAAPPQPDRSPRRNP